jgi:hypothetical protein
VHVESARVFLNVFVHVYVVFYPCVCVCASIQM